MHSLCKFLAGHFTDHEETGKDEGAMEAAGPPDDASGGIGAGKGRSSRTSVLQRVRLKTYHEP